MTTPDRRGRQAAEDYRPNETTTRALIVLQSFQTLLAQPDATATISIKEVDAIVTILQGHQRAIENHVDQINQLDQTIVRLIGIIEQHRPWWQRWPRQQAS